MFDSILKFIFGFAKYTIAFILLILILSYFILKNVVALPVIQHFGTHQYLLNILRFHSDRYGMINNQVEFYDNIIWMQNKDISKNRLVLHKGNMFRYKGYIEKENVEWIAAVIYKDQKPYYGYFVVPKENKDYYYKVYYGNGFYIWSDIKELRDERYRRELNNSNLKIMKAIGGIKMQEIRESNKYRILWAFTDSLYYCDDKYASLVNTITNKYYRKNEEEVFLDISNRWK